MSTTTLWTRLLSALVLAANPAIAQEAQAVFVSNGTPRSIRQIGDAWVLTPDALVGSGVGNFLRGGAAIGSGNFEVRARLSLTRLEGTAASLALGASSHFGLDSRSGSLFVEGPLFGKQRLLGKAAKYIDTGKPFDLIARRRGKTLELSIDGEVVDRSEVSTDILGPIALRPWRNEMRVESFSAIGNLQELPPSVFDDESFTTVFRSGRDGYHTFRIPAVVRTNEGTLLAFAEGRKNGGGDSGDIDLVMRRSSDDGRSWSDLQVLWNDGPHTCGNPCPVVDRQTGRIVLLSTRNLGQDHEREIIAQTSEDTRRVYVLSSDDDGKTFTKPREITSTTKESDWTWYATGPGNGIQLRNGPHEGRLVIPCDHIEADPKRYWSHCIFSDDGGETWQLGSSTPKDKVNECAVAELDDGRLVLNMRNYDRSQRTRQIAFSDDGGATWTAQRHDEELIEPICQASLVRGPKGALWFSNPASRDGRVQMTVRRSTDRGATWKTSWLLHAGPSAYSCLVSLEEGVVGCLFEGGDSSPYEALLWARVELGD